MIDNKNTKPQLTEDKVQDIYVRKNFRNLNDYFSTQNQLYDFKFFDIEFYRATENQKVEHGLSYAPQDVIVTKITGDGIVSFNHGLFDSKYVNLSSDGPARVRFFVGSYWQSTNKQNDVKSSVTEYSAKVSASSSSLAAVSINIVRLTSGSGNYVPSTGAKALEIELVGAGGGGGGSSDATANGGTGGSGTETAFGSLFTASGGLGGSQAFVDNGGSISMNGVIDINSQYGSRGQGGNQVFTPTNTQVAGGMGGSNPLGPGGAGGRSGAAGDSATGFGAGGGGAGGAAAGATAMSGQGGGSGGYGRFLINKNLQKSYSYKIGIKGAGGTAGTNGYVGGDGYDGIIIIKEYY